jgi:exonuclease SbcD
MFRFLHAADLHLDSPMLGLSNRPGAPVDEIQGAGRRAFSRLLDCALSEPVDFVVLAGDIYDRDWKDWETGQFFRRGMVRLAEAGIPVYLISGNHDADSTISRQLSLPANVHVFPSDAPSTVEPEPWPVAIHGMSFPRPAVTENLVPWYPSPVAGKFNLGLLHTSLTGAEGHDSYAPCRMTDLTQKGYDYWALGHIHKPAIVHEAPWIVYSGNIQGRSVKECGERGCRIVTVDDGGEVTACRWEPLNVVRWAVVSVDASGLAALDDIVDACRQPLAQELTAAGDGLLAVRLQITGATPLHGALVSRPDRLEAELVAHAEEVGRDRIWIERVRLQTTPKISLEELAQSDGLTKVVVEAITTSPTEPQNIPKDITTMLGLLPPHVREELEAELTGPGRRATTEAACSLILDRLTATTTLS